MLRTQLNWSRNMKESRLVLAKRLWWAMVYWTKALRVAFRGVRSNALGGKVYHDGKTWFISNWANGPLMNLKSTTDSTYLKDVPIEQTRPVRTPKEYWHRFRTAHRWYMTSWHSIDVNKKLYP